jgi:hypothetical protein
MRRLGLVIAFGVIAGLGALAFVRLAPSDPAVWHVDLTASGFEAGPGTAFCIGPRERYTPAGPMEAELARLDRIALATPRTERLAGSVEEGRITWITRSAVLGFPDFTTAQVMPGPGFCIYGRQRFGSFDWGVNAARIGAWAQELLGVLEVPEMTGLR